MERKYEFISPQNRKNWQETIETIKPMRRGLVSSLRKAIPCKVPDLIRSSNSNQILRLVFEASDRLAYDKVRECKDMIKDAFNSTFPCEHIKWCEEVQCELLEEYSTEDLEDDIYTSLPVEKTENYIERALKRIRCGDSLCESPVERIFFYACIGRLMVVPQYKIGKYRLDFALPFRKIAIEIDGHDYHTTKEQRRKDYQRERALQKLGWHIVRFTGSEVYNDADDCVKELISIIQEHER